MSNRKSKKSQKLGSSRHRNRNRDTEERSNDVFPQTGNEELESKQKECRVASEYQSADASVLLHSPQAATAVTSQQTSELHPHSQSQDYKDLIGQDKAVSKRRKMGSTRKSNREFKGGGIPEEDPEDKEEVSEGISQQYEVTVKEERRKEDCDQQSPSDFSSSQSTKPESSTFEMQHAAFGSTVHVEEALGTDACHDLEMTFQIQPMPMVLSSCETEKTLSAESINDSSNVTVVTQTESKLLLHESDDFSDMCHQMEAIPKSTGLNKRNDSADRPLNENCNEGNRESHNFSGIPECIVMSSKEPTLSFTGDDKQERESTILSYACSAEAKGEGTEVQSTHAINEREQECPCSPEEELLSEWKCIQVLKSSEYREGSEEYTEIHMAGYGKECEDMVKAKSPILVMDPDINMSPNQQSYNEVASLDQHLAYELELPCDSSDTVIHYRNEQCDLSDARLSAGESKIEDYTAQAEESLTEQNTEELHMEERTEEKEAEGEEDKLLDLGSESKGVAFETLSEVTSETIDTDNQADSFAQNDSEEYSSELDMKSKEGAYVDPHAGSNVLPESNINQDDRLYGGMALSSSDSTLDKDNVRENDIDENKNQGFSEEIKSSENICDESTLYIRKEEDSIDYAVAIDETDVLLKQQMGALKRTDINTNDSFDGVSEDGVSAEKVLTTGHFIELDKVSGLFFEEQLHRSGACSEKNTEEDIRDPDKEGSVLQGNILAKEDKAIKDNQEQTSEEYDILLCGGACEDDAPQLSKEQFKAADCVEATADGVTNSALELVHVLYEREDECHLIGNSSFSQAAENPIQPGSSEYPHITKLHTANDNLNEKTENWMEDQMEKDEEIDYTSWVVTEGTEEDTHTRQKASTNTKTEDEDISDHCCENDNETTKASEEWEYIQVLESSVQGNEQYTELHLTGYGKECEEGKTDYWMDDKMEKDEEIDHTGIKQDDGEFITTLLEGGHQPDNDGDQRKMIEMETKQGLDEEHSTPEGPEEQTNRDSEPVHLENTFSLIHIQKSKPIHDNVRTDHSELGTSGQRRKMGSTRKSNRKQVHEGDQKESTEKEEGGTISDKDDLNGYGDREREGTTNLRATSDLLSEPQTAASEEQLGVTDTHFKTNISELKEEKRDHGMTGTLPVIMTDRTVVRVDNVVPEEESNAGAQVEISKQHGKLEVDYEKICDSTSSNEQDMPAVSTGIQNDTFASDHFTEEQPVVGEVHDMESNEKVNQVHSSPACGTIDLHPDSLDIPVNIENIHEAECEQTEQLSGEDPAEQTNRDLEPIHLENTFSLIHIQESKPIHDNVRTDHSELGTSGQRRKMGSTRKSNRKQLHEGDEKESTEELNIKGGGRRDEGDQDGYGTNEDLYPTLRSNISRDNDEVVEEESDETTEERNVCPTDYSTSEDFISICSDPKMHSGLSSQTTELGLTIKMQPSQITEPSDSKETENSEENAETGDTEPHAQSQNKKKKRFGSTRRSQGGHRTDSEVAEQTWKDVEVTEGLEDIEEERQETTDQAATSDLLSEPQITVSEEQLGVTDTDFQTDISELKEEIRDHGMIDTLPDIMSDRTVEVLEDESKAGAQVEIMEQHGKLEVDDEKIRDSTSSNEQEMPPVSTEIQNDTSTCHNSSIDPKVHSGLSSQTTELGLTTNIQPSPITEPSDTKAGGANSKENVETGNTEPHTQREQKKKRKFGSTRKTQTGHRPDTEGAERKWIDVEALERSEHSEEERQETTDLAAASDLLTELQIAVSEEQLGITDTHFQTDISELKVEERDHGMMGTLPVIMSDITDHQVDNVGLKDGSKAEAILEIMEQHEKLEVDYEKICDSTSSNELEMPPVSTEIQNDTSICHNSSSDPKIHSGLSSQTTELGLSINVYPSPVTEPLVSSGDGENSNENVETGNTEPHAQREQKKKRKFGSTRKTQGGHRPDTEGVERNREVVEAIEGHGEDERQETTDKAASTDLLTCSDKQILPVVKTKIQIHTFSDSTAPQEPSMVVDGQEMGTENIHASSRKGPMEIGPEMHYSHDISENTESTHDQKPWDHILQGPEEQLRIRESETEQPESSRTLMLIPESKTTEVKVLSENSGKRRKMGSTRKGHREPLHRGDQKDNTEEMQDKENAKEQKIDKTAGLTEEANSEADIPNVILTSNAETSDAFIEKQSETCESTDITSESITITSLNLEKFENKKRKMASTRRNFKGKDGKKTKEITGEMDSRAEEDITTEETTNVDTVLDDTLSEWGIILAPKPQIHPTLDGAEGSLLSEIQRELKISCQSQLNTTAPELISERLLDNTLEACNKELELELEEENISEIPQQITEECKSTLELPSTQSSQACTEPSSPGRRRKFGSTRKTPRNQLAEDTDDDRKVPEQETENLETGKNSEHKRETETAMLQVPEDMRGSVDITSEVQAVSRVGKNDTVSMKQPIPASNRKFGSRRKTNGNRNLSGLTPSESEPSQQETEDIQAVSNELMICDPYFIPETESTPISQPSDNEEIKASLGSEKVGQSVASASTGAALVCLDDLRKSALYNGSTGRRETIDFEQWPEQIPDFGAAVYNVVMVGNSNVGKTSFIRRFQCGQFSQDYSSTIGVDTCVQNITLGNRTVKLNVWDTAGQERYHSLTWQVFHKAQSLLLMYDTTSSKSFYAVRNWISQIQERAPADVIIMLLGNKNDCAGRQVKLQAGEDLAREYSIHFMECSAATGENVSECVKTLAWLLVKQRVRREEEQTILQPKQPQKSGCC